MDLQHLRVFIHFAKSGHLTETAGEFGLQKGTVWKYINRLEEEIGVPLYEHSKKHITLTEEGKRYLETAKAIVARIDECSAGLSRGDYRAEKSGNLKVGAFELMTPYGITDQLISFKHSREGININIHQNSDDVLETLLQNGTLELAYIRKWGEPDSRYDYLQVCSDEAYIALPEGHPLAGKDRVDWGELRNELFFLLFEGGITYQECLKCCEKAGFTPKVAGTSTSADTVFRMVAGGMGISFILNRPSKRFGTIPGIVLKRMETPRILGVYLVHFKKYDLSMIGSEYWDFVKKAGMIL